MASSSRRTASARGYPVVIFGGDHADVPINEHAGAHVAELFATGNRPCLIDLGGWMVEPRTRFWIEFASALFKHTRGQRYLVIDEVHNFCPKGKIFSPDAGKMLHWTNRLASEGLGKGVNMVVASQRPQKVHNDTLSSCETLIAMRVIHPSDRDAIQDWIQEVGDASGSEVLKTVAQMERGEGWVWSPEIKFGPERVKFPLFKTYDSFRPQTAADTKKLKGWAEVDLDEVRAKLDTVVAEAKANDPRELRRQVAQLSKELAAAKKHPVQVTAKQPKQPKPPKKIEVPILSERTMKRAERLVERLDKLSRDVNGYLGRVTLEISKAGETLLTGIRADLAKAEKLTAAATANPNPGRVWAEAVARPTRPALPGPFIPPDVPKAAPARQTVAGVAIAGPGNGKVPAGQRRILTALAQFGPSRPSKIRVLAGIGKRETFSTYVSRLKTSGYVNTSTDELGITQAGLVVLGSYEPLPSGRALVEYWKNELSGGIGAIFNVLIDRPGEWIPYEKLMELAGIQKPETLRTYISRLKVPELVESKHDRAKIATEFETLI